MTIPYPGDVDWPSEWQSSIIRGKYVDLTGAPIANATIIVTPSPKAMVAAASGITIIPAKLSATTDGHGTFSVTVPATDDPDISPTDFTYEINESFNGGRVYSIKAPAGQIVDVAMAAPVAVSNGVAITKGEKGDPGAPGEVTTAALNAALSAALHPVEAVVTYTTTQPLRSTVTTDAGRPVRWRSPNPPSLAAGYAIQGLDVWEKTP